VLSHGLLGWSIRDLYCFFLSMSVSAWGPVACLAVYRNYVNTTAIQGSCKAGLCDHRPRFRPLPLQGPIDVPWELGLESC
jgi:hypothetical protein